MSVDTKSLLERGYFPSELPPPFHTRTFAAYVASDINKLEPITKKKSTRPTTHNFMKHGMLRRKLSIPNPMNQMNVARCIETHWADIQPLLTSKLSLSLPISDPTNQRAVTRLKSFEGLIEAKAQTRAVSRHILRTDVARFYESIYTHSIPWSIHGKIAAKQDRTDALWGNSLDKFLRNGQDQQTIGIPIGPDTSLIIAELLLCDVERQINEPKQGGFRYVDDIELGFKSVFAAQGYMNRLQEELSAYELVLNPSKTSIHDLPHPIEESWVPPLRSFDFRSSAKGLKSDLVRFFDTAYGLHANFPNKAVLAYAIRRLSSVNINSESNMKLCEDLVLQSVIAEPGSIRHALNLLDRFAKAGCPIKKDELQQNLNLLAQYHSNLGHAGEVAWALWGMIEFGLPLEDETVKSVVKAADSIRVLLLLDAKDRGLFQDVGQLTNLEAYMTESELESERWMVAYEADRQGWMQSIETKNHVKSHEFFKRLKKAGVSFYDVTASGFPLPKISALPGISP